MIHVKKYRKKPVVVEAIQVKIHNVYEVIVFLGKNMDAYQENEATGDPRFIIETLEGNMIANVGDYIIKGVEGEFYPCKQKIFEATYEKVE